MRVYENGIEAHTLLGSRMFYSFGELTDVAETENPIDGPLYMFRSRGSTLPVPVRRDWPGLAELMEPIRSKLGRPEFLVELEPVPEEESAKRRTEYGFYGAVVSLGIGLAAFFSAVVNPGDSLGVILSGFGLIMPIMVSFAVAYATARMRRLPKVFPLKLNTKVAATIIVLSLAYFAASHVVFSNALGPSPLERHIGARPSTSYLTPGVYEDQTIQANASIVVDPGTVLEVRNSTLSFEMSADKQFGIWVAAGGRLVLDGSSVRPADYRFGYTFEVMGSALVRNSTVSGLWGEWDDFDGGMEIYSDDVVIESSHFFGARQSTILVVDASPLIANSTIEGAGDDGIELQNSRARIVNNTITRCEWAMYMYRESRPLIEDNVIADNAFGFLIVNSSPVIRGNAFERNEHTAIIYREHSSPVLEGNTYDGNGQNVVDEGDGELPDAWTIANVAVAAICLVVVLRANRPRKDRSAWGSSPPKVG
jgi:parallel beta-helix repeat protein